jgi:hypothetical protein
MLPRAVFPTETALFSGPLQRWKDHKNCGRVPLGAERNDQLDWAILTSG